MVFHGVIVDIIKLLQLTQLSQLQLNTINTKILFSKLDFILKKFSLKKAEFVLIGSDICDIYVDMIFMNKLNELAGSRPSYFCPILFL